MSSFPDNTALDILQAWGVYPDKARGRSGARPTVADLPPSIPLKNESQRHPGLRSYVSTVYAAVVRELWKDARKGDSRVSSPQAWVKATVVGPHVHPSVDRIDQVDPLDEDPDSNLLFLEVPNEKVKSFAGFDVIAVRHDQDPSPTLLNVRKLKRHVNQLIIRADVINMSLPPFLKGGVVEIAPYTNIKTRSAELKAVTDLANRRFSHLDNLLMPEFRMARVSKSAADTNRLPVKHCDRGVPEVYNRSLGEATTERLGPHDPLPHPSPVVASKPQHQHLHDPKTSVLQAVDQLQAGLILVQA